MTDADRAREVLADAYEAEGLSGRAVRDPIGRLLEYNHRIAIAAMLAYTAEREAQAHAAGRAEGLREAAEICGTLAETDYADGDAFDAATGCEYAIHKIIRARITTTGERS